MKRCQERHLVLPAEVFAKVQRFARERGVSTSKAMDMLADGLERYEQRRGAD